MNVEAIRAQNLIQDICEGLGPEETIEICDAAIEEAERIKELCEKEIEERDEEEDLPY